MVLIPPWAMRRVEQGQHDTLGGPGTARGSRHQCRRSSGRQVCWHSHKPSANAPDGRHRRSEEMIHADLRLPMPGLRSRIRSPAGLHRRPPHGVSPVRGGLAAQEVRVGGHCVQGQRLLQDRQSRLGWWFQVDDGVGAGVGRFLGEFRHRVIGWLVRWLVEWRRFQQRLGFWWLGFW